MHEVWPIKLPMSCPLLQMTGIIGERENKITQSLSTMGMLRSAYWLSWITWESCFAFIITWVTIAFGAAVQLDFFLDNSVGNTFFTLFLFQLAMMGFAFVLSALIRKSSQAVILGFVIFITGWIFQVRSLRFTFIAHRHVEGMRHRAEGCSPSSIAHARMTPDFVLLLSIQLLRCVLNSEFHQRPWTGDVRHKRHVQVVTIFGIPYTDEYYHKYVPWLRTRMCWPPCICTSM